VGSAFLTLQNYKSLPKPQNFCSKIFQQIFVLDNFLLSGKI